MKQLETQIQHAMVDYLRLKYNAFVWVNKNPGTYDPVRNVFRRNTTMKGISDLIGLLPGGRFLAVEVKRKGNHMSQDQKRFLEEIRASGGIAFCARSFEDIDAELNKREG